jgi:hypothetical protein
MVVASRRPCWSRAAATWVCLWVSTPMVTRGGGGMPWWWCHPLDATGRVVAPAGRADNTATSLVAQAPIRSRVPGRCCCWRRPRRRTDNSDSRHQAGGRRGQAQVATAPSSRGHSLGPTDLLAGSKPVEPRVRPVTVTARRPAWRPWRGSTGRKPGTEPPESRVRPAPQPPPGSSQSESAGIRLQVMPSPRKLPPSAGPWRPAAPGRLGSSPGVPRAGPGRCCGQTARAVRPWARRRRFGYPDRSRGG